VVGGSDGDPFQLLSFLDSFFLGPKLGREHPY
jgi:hypothetical protein